MNEIAIKEERIREILQKKKLEGILFATQHNFLWATGGKRNQIIKNDDTSLVHLLFTRRKKYLISTMSDANRVMDEELMDYGFELLLYDWYKHSVFDALKKLEVKGLIGCDFFCKKYPFIDEEIAKIRINLTSYEINRVERLCKQYTELLTDFCYNIKPRITEVEVAADLTYLCAKRNIFPLVLMVGSDERIFKYRHPVASNKQIKNYMLIATVVERDGINISISRSIYFGKVPKELEERHRAVNIIESTYYRHSRPGITLRELFEVGMKTYMQLGHPEEWKNHTQGGIIGYRPREFLITSKSEMVLNADNLLSFNPTITGVKAEDIIIVSTRGIKQLSIDKRWPYEEINIAGDIFLKPKILEIN